MLISNYPEYYRLTSYFRRYTDEMIGVAMGINNLLEVFNEKYYESLQGGILEAFGRLFRNAVKLYIYPMRRAAYDSYKLGEEASVLPTGVDVSHAFAKDVLVTARNLQVNPRLHNLYAHLIENHYLECITGFNSDILDIFSVNVLDRIKSNDPSWEEMVPEPIAAAIKRHGLFEYAERIPETPA